MGRLRYHCLSGLLLLLALAAKAEEATTATVPCDKNDDKNKEDKFSHFEEIFLTVIFIILVWISGKIAAAAGAPSLVGEILVGVILGPHVVDFVPFPSALKSIGEVGLCLHALEAGLMVDVEMLEIVGARGLAVGFVGSAAPLGLGLLVALAWGARLTPAFVVGACTATMSTGIALNVLKAGSVINQPIGQLIIAAASVNELVNITLLTCVDNMMRRAKPMAYALPLGSMILLVLIVGWAAVKIVPRWLEKHVLPRVPQHHRPNAVLLCLFSAAIILIPVCKYSGSSELLGAFLAGLCFCSDHVVHATWDRQVKRVYAWLMRLFFAATIGFEIPIEHMNTQSLTKACILCTVSIAKLAMGAFAQPLDSDHFWILAWAWGEWGEMSFFIAGVAAADLEKTGRIISKDTHNAICLAVLVSMLVCPAGLRRKLEEYEKKAKYQIAEAIADTADTSEEIKVQLVLQFGVSRGRREVLLALRRRGYLSEIVSEFGPLR
jgi:Kef-type K+ transport system membrane component KefB